MDVFVCVQAMKQQRVHLMKQLKAESEQFRRTKANMAKEMLQLKSQVKITLSSQNLATVSPLLREHLSYDDCLEDKREHYQNCSVLYCVTQLCTIICTLI